MSAVLESATDGGTPQPRRSLGDTRANYRELAASCAHTPPPTELKRHIDGLDAIEVSQDYYGHFCDAANMMIDARLAVLREAYAHHRAIWEKNLADMKEASTFTEEEVKPESGPGFLEALHALEEGKRDGFRPGAFGDLIDEAIRVQDDAIERFGHALARIAVMVVDPDILAADPGNVPVQLLEYALNNFKQLPLTLDTFRGHADLLEQAKKLHPLSVAKQEARIATAKERTVGKVHEAIENRDEMEHRHRVHDAGLTPEQRGARHARMLDAAEPMYKALRRLTEIATLDETNFVGTLDADGLVALVQQAQAIEARVEGRLN